MQFEHLPTRPNSSRYETRLRKIESLTGPRQRKERLIEEGMAMDRATAVDDFHWFCKRFTSFDSFKVAEGGHPLQGTLWIDHPFVFWLCRQFQAVHDAPAGHEFWLGGEPGWVWFKIHRLAFKTTLLLASILWLHARDEMDTVLLATHNAEKIGSGMGKGMLADLQSTRLRDHFEQFRNLREAQKLGYVVDRPAGPREQSLMVSSIIASVASVHPRVYAFDDAVADHLRDNPEQIAKIKNNISSYVSLMMPGSPVIVCNTPYDEADPWIAREKDGLFARVISQAATYGGDFTPAGQPNLHTRKHFDVQRRQTKNDAIYFPQYELIFYRSAAQPFDWSWMTLYHQEPEELAALSPYVHIIVDGAKGTKRSDFTVIRVITWTAHDRWATLDLIREKVGVSKAMQLLAGRDPDDPTTGWMEEGGKESWQARPGRVGVVERWMRIDSGLTIWFDEQGNSGWMAAFVEHCRLRRLRFGGKMPIMRPWPEIHRKTGTKEPAAKSVTKAWRIAQLEIPYQQGKAAYPARGFLHGSSNGHGGGPDRRDTRQQFEEDEFNRLRHNALPPNDDMLDSESLLAMPQAVSQMRRPAEGSGFTLGGIVYPAATVSNPFGLPGGGNGGAMIPDMNQGRTWVSLL